MYHINWFLVMSYDFLRLMIDGFRRTLRSRPFLLIGLLLVHPLLLSVLIVSIQEKDMEWIIFCGVTLAVILPVSLFLFYYDGRIKRREEFYAEDDKFNEINFERRKK